MGFPMKQVQPVLNAEPIYSYGQWLQRCDDRRGSLMGLKKKILTVTQDYILQFLDKAAEL